MIELNHLAFNTAQRSPLMTLSHPDAPNSGLLSRTRVETDRGWRRVEHLRQGDKVRTGTGDLAPICNIERTLIAPDDYDGPRHVLLVPVGVLGSCIPFLLLPEQRILIESPLAEKTFGVTSALVAAKALAGHRGITPLHLPMESEIFTLRFEDEVIVRVNAGVLVWCPPAAGCGSSFEELEGDRAERLFRLVGLGYELGRRRRRA
jgi:hypothetical protein